MAKRPSARSWASERELIALAKTYGRHRKKDRAQTRVYSENSQAAGDQNQEVRRPMKFATSRPYADPEAAARKLIEIANSVEAVQDGRIHIELINGPMLFEQKATPAEYSAGLNLAMERGWLTMHESGTYVKFTQAGADFFA
jgi:hypothetical protein